MTDDHNTFVLKGTDLNGATTVMEFHATTIDQFWEYLENFLTAFGFHPTNVADAIEESSQGPTDAGT